MPDIHCRPYCLLLILICAVGAEGQDPRRGDTSPDFDSPSTSCSCSSAITASVFITTIVVLILVTLWWCYFRHKARKIDTKPDPQTLSRAAYDNPYFQGDDLDQPDGGGGQARINAVSQSQPTQVSTSPCPSAKVKTTATNTTGTLERGKTTLERVINAVIGSGRTGSAKRSKDDSYIEPSRVTVPLQGHDFTGLGFTVHGNLKEGLYIKEVMSRGPASQSGQVVPGDRVIGFTVLTDHIVFEDALTILTYASPYPVLLHLEKGKGVFSGAVTQTSKSKLQSTSAPSLVLIHPSFKSQSQDDLHKIKTLDIEKLKIGTIVPVPSKGKAPSVGIKAPSPGLKHELPKIQASLNVQRSAESRHSERAIDVPGVEIKGKTKPPDVKLNIDCTLDDKVELASVEVHRPMSSTFEMEAPKGSINLPRFNDAEPSVAAEHIESNSDLRVPKFNKPDPKIKFGIKVFPDIGFPVRLNKNVDVDLEKGESKVGGFRERDPPDVTLENETNFKIENSSSLNLGVNVGAPEIDLKHSLKGKNIDVDTSPDLNIKQSTKPKSESKFGFGLGFKGFSRDKDDDFEKIDTDGVNVVLPQVNVRTNVDNDLTTKDNSDSEEEGKKSIPKHGFRIGLPDLNLHSFGRKGSTEQGNGSPEIRDEKVAGEASKSKGFKMDLPDFNLPSFSATSGKKSKQPVEDLNKEDTFIKLETPDLSGPEINVSTELKAEANIPKYELITDDLKGKVDLSGPELSKVPNVRMPSLGFQTKGLEDDEDSKEKEESKKTKTKHGFKFGLPSFSLNSKSKSDKETDSENESDNEHKLKMENDNNKNKNYSNKEFSVEIPKVNLNLKEEKNRDPNEDETKSASKFGLKFEAPDINLPSFSLKNSKSADHEANIKISPPDTPEALATENLQEIKTTEISDLGFESNLKSDADISDFGVNIKGPDVSIPSLDIKLKKEMTVDDSRESDEVKSKKDKKKHKEKSGFNFKFPHFSTKGDKRSKETPSPEVEESVKGSGISGVKPDINVDIEVPKVSPINVDFDAGVEPNSSSSGHDKHSKKSKFGITFKAPDLSMPSVHLRSKKKDDIPDIKTKINAGSISVREPDLDMNLDLKKIEQPDFTLPNETLDIKLPGFDMDGKSVNVESPEVKITKSEIKGNTEDEKLKKPDFSLPSFRLKGDINEKDLEQKTNLNFGLEGSKMSSPDIEVKTITPRSDVDIDGPDFEIPSLQMDPRLTLHKDENEDVDEKSKFDFKINLPEFKLPKFGSSEDSKESLKTDISDIGELDVKGKAPKYDMPDFKISPNLAEVPTLSVTDVVLSTDVDDGLKSEKGKKKGFGFNMNLPNFGIKDGAERKIEADYSLPDELKAEVGKHYRGDFEVSLDSPDLISKEFTIPTLSSPDLGFEDDKSKSGKAENSDSDGKNDFGFTAILPDLTMPKFQSKEKIHPGYEDETSNKNISLDSNLPDIDTEFVDDDMSDELNITDATKKKRFGFKIKDPELTMPDFMKRLGSDECIVKVALEGNQSDEVKSLNLKLKTPSLDFPEAASLSKTDYNRMDEEDEETLRVKLPRVKLPGFHSKLKVDGPNLDKSIGDSGYSDQGENKLCEADLPSPKYSSEVKLFGIGHPTKKYNESDEWKIKGISGVKMPSLNFKVNSNDECPEDDREQMKYKLTERDIDFNVDDPDFVIPDIKTFSTNIPTLEIDTESLDIKTNKPLATSAQFVTTIPSYSLNLNSPQFQEKNDAQGFMISCPKFTKFGRDALNVNDIDVSLDSSSFEMESDLPEADSDLQKASLEFPYDCSLKDNTTVKVENKFGNAFGFQGFKKHIEIDGMDTSINADIHSEFDKNKGLEAEDEGFKLIKVEPTVETVNQAMLLEDLPEADFHFDSKEGNYTDGFTSRHSLPEGDQPIGFSLQQRLDLFEKNLIKKNVEASDSESDAEKSKHEKRDYTEKNTIKINSEETKTDNERKSSVEDDNGKGKFKGKSGIGFGFKGFAKTSDSEDCEIQKKIATEPEGDTFEGKEKARVKAKKTFSFKAFGRSSSDTDEENIEKVSDKPMVNVEQEEKVKLRNKNSLTFGFKHRNSRNSDSEDNDGDKVEIHPQTEGGSKKQKMKFGFMGKSKASESEHNTQPENLQEKQDLDEETKIKPKSAPVVASRSSKEIKYDTRSESEGGEDEKMSMDSRGEDSRSKSRYGLNFGFKKTQGKTSSDSEGGENDERRVNLNERGSNDKKEPKGKSLKLGFKGLKNLKGKIQSEINKMRHDSPSSDDDIHSRDDEEHSQGEKRKKVSKKKEKEKKHIHESEGAYLDTSEEATIASAATAVKDNRRSRMERKPSATTSSSSSDSSSDDEEKSLDVKKKKKFKGKRKEEIKISSSEAIDVKAIRNDEPMEIEERVSSTQRNIPIKLPNLLSEGPAHVMIVSSEPIDGNDLPANQDTVQQSMEVQSSPRRYVVVREMKLKQSTPHPELGEEVIEVVEREKRHREIPPPVFLREKANFKLDTDVSGSFWGSDSDMEKSQLNNGVGLSDAEGNLTVSGKQRSLTDSEELKRRAASLGDLSRLHEGIGGNGILLERAVSLDFKNPSIGHPALHVRRLQLPDSSATSIDEADEPLSSSSPKKLELTGGLKAASQWGTLEEALRLGVNSSENISKGSSPESSSIITTTVVKTEDPNKGGPISNIEISGDRGSSVTALSISNNWNDSFEDEKPPSLPSSPIPIARTTITVKEELPSMLQTARTNDSNIVILGGSERFQNLNNIRNVNVEMNPAFNNNEMMESLISTGVDEMGFYLNKTEEADRFQQGDDNGIVTVTMIPADSYSTTVIQNPPPVPRKPKANRPLSTPPELISYENVMETPIVTVSHGRMHENGEVVIETSDHNLSDEFMTPDSTPQKSMTQITLEGDGGYTVTEGPYSRTVIISNPDSLSPVSIVPTDASLPYLG